MVPKKATQQIVKRRMSGPAICCKDKVVVADGVKLKRRKQVKIKAISKSVVFSPRVITEVMITIK